MKGAKGSWKSYKATQASLKQDRADPEKAAYEAEIAKRRETKLNWGIKNRWEQRELEAVIKNKDVRAAAFRDIDRMRSEQYGKSLAVFNSVDEIFYFLDNIFIAGLDEKHIGMALDVFLRDFGQFEEKDLEHPTFKKFVRELGVSLITFTKEENYVKTARFLDWYIVDDATLWVNLEMTLFNKEEMFSPKSLLVMASNFAAQQEGS